MTGSRMPIELSHVFNSNNRDYGYGYGYGWRLNLYQEIAYISGSNQYTYIDGDGTKHYFNYNNDPQNPAYIDESGLNFILKKNADNTYTMTDKKGNLLNFTTSGYLTSMKDSNGNTLTLTYTNGKISKVTDGAGRITTLELDSNKLLTGIVDPAGRRTSFQYTAKSTGYLLTSITYPDNKTTTYTYDENKNLTSAVNYDGYKITYTYYSISPYRVMKAEEGNTAGTVGNFINISYGFNTTTFTDARGNINIYQFNDNGNTMNIRDGDGYAQYYKYIENGGNVNKLTSESKLQKTTVNYLLNHNAEITSSWGAVNDGGSTGSTSYTTNEKYLGNQSLMVTKTNSTGRQSYTQYVTLEKGKTYTLSGYVKTSGITNSNNKGAAIFLSYQDSTGALQSVYSKYVSGDKDWQRLEVTFTLPSNAASAIVYARCGIVEETGTAYFDCLQLEDGKIANRYNLVENADFKYSYEGVPSFWTKNTYTDSNDTLVAGIENDIGVPNIDRNAFKMIGCAAKSKNIYQKINVSGTTNDVYSIGGWAKGDSIPSGSGIYFAIDVGFESQANPGTFDWHVINFNEDSSSWQYAADRIIPAFDYRSIYVYFLYYNNANTAYFDGMQLYKEEFSKSYTYDSAGNVTKISDLAGKNSTFEYTNNDLSKLINPNGGIFNYVYDGNHNITSATNATNVVYSFTYDSYGNPLTATIKDSLSSPTISLTTTAEYTDGTPQDTSYNYLKKLVDPSGNTVLYSYNESKGILNNVTDPKGKATNYSYDDLDRLKEVKKNVGGTDIKNTYTYENDRLKTINHNGFDYSFNYDSFGNILSVAAGPWNLITNEYEELNVNGTAVHTGRLLASNYGNNQTVGFNYDSLGRVTAKTYNGQERFKYLYDDSGNIGYHEDLVNNVSYRYIYDLADRLSEIADSNGNSIKYGFDNNNNVQSIAENISGSSYVTAYTYDGDNKVTKVNISGGSEITYAYDKIGRLDAVTVTYGTINSVTSYDYSTAGKLESVTLPGGRTISYTYDANGNIETVTDSGEVIKYYYNELDEVIREDNDVLNKTIVYAYDDGGNILSKTEYSLTSDPNPQNIVKTYNYSYGDTGWKDKLTSYDGKAITYDAIGNPLSYDGYTFTWEEGRQLARIQGNSLNISYKYNDQGIRTEKTVNGVTTKYYLLGDKVILETNGTDAIHYSYDTHDNLVSMNLNGVEYYYVRNGQGDIVGLLDSTGTQVVSYTYDSWGKIISIDGSLATTVGVKNPYRYRGYRYDEETKLYYLQSRFYNPEWGRFVNADDVEVIKTTLEGFTDKNLFTYTDNNPVNRSDNEGYFWHIAAGAIIGATINAATKIINNVMEGKIWNDSITSAILTGALSGGLAATGVGLVGQIVGNASISAGAAAYGQYASGNGFDAGTIIRESVVGGIGGLLGGKGVGTNALNKLGKQTIKRTIRTFYKNGIKAAMKESKKAFSYYSKNAGYVYGGLTRGIIKSNIPSIINTIYGYSKDF